MHDVCIQYSHCPKINKPELLHNYKRHGCHPTRICCITPILHLVYKTCSLIFIPSYRRYFHAHLQCSILCNVNIMEALIDHCTLIFANSTPSSTHWIQCNRFIFQTHSVDFANSSNRVKLKLYKQNQLISWRLPRVESAQYSTQQTKTCRCGLQWHEISFIDCGCSVITPFKFVVYIILEECGSFLVQQLILTKIEGTNYEFILQEPLL